MNINYKRTAHIFVFFSFISIFLMCSPLFSDPTGFDWRMVGFTFILMFLGMYFITVDSSRKYKEREELKKSLIAESKYFTDSELVNKYKSEPDENLKKIYIEELVSRYDSEV